jgi:hypothetical protein
MEEKPSRKIMIAHQKKKTKKNNKWIWAGGVIKWLKVAADHVQTHALLDFIFKECMDVQEGRWETFRVLMHPLQSASNINLAFLLFPTYCHLLAVFIFVTCAVLAAAGTTLLNLVSSSCRSSWIFFFSLHDLLAAHCALALFKLLALRYVVYLSPLAGF